MVIKNIFWAFVIPVFFFSCDEGAKKSGGIPAEDEGLPGINKEKNSALVYLDTAENMYNILCQGWVNADDADALEGMAENSKFEIPYRSFYLSPEGSYVKNPRNAMDYGTWHFDETTKIVTINNTIDREKDVYKIAQLAYNEMILVNVAVKSTTNLKFVSPGNRFKNAADDPFYLEHNRWRIKPKAKETGEAIHRRLKENIHFFIVYYKSIIARDDKYVSFWGLPSCFKWYGGGIFLKKETELQENWLRCFYNKEQAMQAYALAERLLEQKYVWPKDEKNWLKQNLAVLEQMYKKMDELH